ncbi:MAG: DUF2742 domain-containing protein [Mycobacterium sp.]
MTEPSRRDSPGSEARATSTTPIAALDFVGSRKVSFWQVREFVTAVLDQVNGWPMAGTVAWCLLAHDDPRKWAALLDAAQHWALRVETCQEAMAEASRAISADADWGAVARGHLRQANAVASGAYIPRKTA